MSQFIFMGPDGTLNISVNACCLHHAIDKLIAETLMRDPEVGQMPVPFIIHSILSQLPIVIEHEERDFLYMPATEDQQN